MKEYLDLGQCPYEETPAQVGEPNYRTNAIRQCQAYIQAIRNYLGNEPDGAQLLYRNFPHDFGSYFEVVCYYDPANADAVNYARRCEKEAPATWQDGGVRPPDCDTEKRRGLGR
jgi:hypothetical protein